MLGNPNYCRELDFYFLSSSGFPVVIGDLILDLESTWKALLIEFYSEIVHVLEKVICNLTYDPRGKKSLHITNLPSSLTLAISLKDFKV